MTPEQWHELIRDTTASLLFGAVWFCAGVAWAAYRAVGWVERIRAWAYSVDTDTKGEQ